jgi:hypothetical protein
MSLGKVAKVLKVLSRRPMLSVNHKKKSSKTINLKISTTYIIVKIWEPLKISENNRHQLQNLMLAPQS